MADLRNPDQRTSVSEEKIYSPFEGGKYTITSPYGQRWGRMHNGVDVGVPCGKGCIAPFDGTVTHVSTSGFGTAGGMIHLRANKDVAGLKKGDKIGWGHISAANVSVGTNVKAGKKIATSGGAPCHVHFIYQKGGDGSIDGTDNPGAIVTALMQGEAASTGDAEDGGGGGGGGASGADMLSTAKAAAFVQDLAFPGFQEQVEAQTLFGPRSLMNDKPLFPFVEQLTQASMRSFQSLPNGNFYAFYPDYFGHQQHRTPYWNIDDIEILSGQIELTDEALATHVFAVGDINHNAMPGVDWFDRMVSTGVVNIFNATQSGFTPEVIDDADNSRQSKKDAAEQAERTGKVATNPEQVIQFLKRYGARPHVEEAGFVRNPAYEAFLAYQTFNLLWARQFLTEFQFTFMPELFPGGLVAFPAHGLQCYIDQVDHTFDYEAGFTTTAQLSAPASLSDAKLNTDPLSFGLVQAGK